MKNILLGTLWSIFLSGLYLLLTLLCDFNISLLKYFKIEKKDITRNPSLTIFLLIPGLYLLSQVVLGIDLLFFKIGRRIEDYALKNNYWLIDKFNCFFNGNRIVGIIAKNSNPLKLAPTAIWRNGWLSFY